MIIIIPDLSERSRFPDKWQGEKINGEKDSLIIWLIEY